MTGYGLRVAGKRHSAEGIAHSVCKSELTGRYALCAARVPADKIDYFAETVNRYPGVTHNYQRDNTYNVWFTFIAPSREEIEDNLRQIIKDTGVEDILNLPATKVFKIRAEFEV